MNITTKEHQRRLLIYNKMYPDADLKAMAQEMFITPSQVHRWIRAHNLEYTHKKGNRLSKAEQERRLTIYYSFRHQGKTNHQLATALGMRNEGLRKWIRDNNLVQLNTHYVKIKLTPYCHVWDTRNGKVGNNRKKSSYVRHRPKWEIENIRDFAITLLELNRKKHIPVADILKICRKG